MNRKIMLPNKWSKLPCRNMAPNSPWTLNLLGMKPKRWLLMLSRAASAFWRACCQAESA
ncbi:hypothetical protein D3C76_1461630 [compost metagenome]